MWKLVDKISGVIYENKMRFKILEVEYELIENYKQDNIKTYIQYIGNQEYILKELINYD